MGPRARRRRTGRVAPARDMERSAFADILADFVRRMAGARAAALVDSEGETVDYAGASDPFELKVAAAHWRIVLSEVDAQRPFAGLRWMIVRGERRSYVVHALPDGYALVIALGRRAGFAPFVRPLSVCLRALGEEAQWAEPRRAARGAAPRGAGWFAVDVECDRRGRPTLVRVADASYGAEVLGAIVGLRRRERGYRARLANGKELTLVREPGGFWYADDSPR